MTRPEALAATERLRRRAAEDWVELLRLYEGAAHVALGHASWAEYCELEFGVAKSEAHRLLDAGRGVRRLVPHLGTEGISRTQALVFAACGGEREVRALCAAVEEAGGFRRITAVALQRVLDELRGVVPEFPVVPNELPVNRTCPRCDHSWWEA